MLLLDGDALPFRHARRLGPGPASSILFYPALYRILSGSDWFVSQVLRNAWGPDAPHFGHAILDVFERPFRVDGTADALKQFAGSDGPPGVSSADLARVRVPRAVGGARATPVDPLQQPAARPPRRSHVPIVPHPSRRATFSMLADARAVAAAIDREATRATR